MRKMLILFLSLGLLSQGCVTGRSNAGHPVTEIPTVGQEDDAIPVAETQTGLFAVVSDEAAELLCLKPETIGELETAQIECYKDLDLCGADLDGCRREMEVVKGSKWSRFQNYLTFLTVGALVGALAAD